MQPLSFPLVLKTVPVVHVLPVPSCIPKHRSDMLSLSPSRMDSSYERRSRRSSHHSRSPSRRREADRRRSSSRHVASHKPSRSSSHRQPDSRWTRSQERSSGGAASPAHSEDAYMPFDKVCTTCLCLLPIPACLATGPCLAGLDIAALAPAYQACHSHLHIVTG